MMRWCRYVKDAYGDRWSRLTFLIYLNDGCAFDGGCTTFFVPAAKVGCLDAWPIKPVAGSVVVFPHGDNGGTDLVHHIFCPGLCGRSRSRVMAAGRRRAVARGQRRVFGRKVHCAHRRAVQDEMTSAERRRVVGSKYKTTIGGQTTATFLLHYSPHGR